jgi:pimeloyl-ACP methyl ester carboxylesterase
MNWLFIVVFLFCSSFTAQQALQNTVNEGQIVKDPLTLAFEQRDRSAINDIVMLCHTKMPCVVDSLILKDAYQENRYLNESILFYTKFLKDINWIRDFLYSPVFNGQHSKTTTVDGEVIHYTHFNRGSNILLIIGGGLATQEMMSPFVQMFPRYDVVIFNHRGIEFDKASIFNPFTWSYCMSSACVFENLNGSKMTFGKAEENDVLAIIFDLFKKKAYDKVYGLATCYSAPIFIKTAIARPGIFDKLILDGGWMSTTETLKRFITEVKERFKENGFSKIVPDPNGSLGGCVGWFGKKFSGINPEAVNFNFTNYVQQLTVPVLFFHGANDAIVPNSEFINMWNQIPSTEKAVILTLSKHVNTHLKFKEFYKYSAEAFFDLPYGEFIKKFSRA